MRFHSERACAVREVTQKQASKQTYTCFLPCSRVARGRCHPLVCVMRKSSRRSSVLGSASALVQRKSPFFIFMKVNVFVCVTGVDWAADSGRSVVTICRCSSCRVVWLWPSGWLSVVRFFNPLRDGSAEGRWSGEWRGIFSFICVAWLERKEEIWLVESGRRADVFMHVLIA